MVNCKLQVGCLLIVLYISFIYYQKCHEIKEKHHVTLYDALLLTGILCLIFDGVTAYTVNHLETVSSVLNRISHMIFLLSIDALVFLLFLYVLSITQGIPKGKLRLLIYCPYIINVIVVVANIKTLEYRRGTISNYSMGFSAYTCFVMVGVYILFTILALLSRWNYIEGNKRISILTFLLVLLGVTGYQTIFPEALVTSIGTTILILGAYMNQEDPAMKVLSHYHDETVMGFATLIESKDNSTGGHVKRTTQYVRLIEDELLKRGFYRDVLTKDYRNNLIMAAPMHDIGKIAIPDSILKKAGRLTTEEYEEMKLHTVKGGKIIQETFGNLGNEQYQRIAYEVSLHHHEKWNGTGYPDGLKQDEIPLSARIMAVADVFDAISAKRCYRDAMPLDECFDIIEKEIGESLDPVIARVFIESKEKVKEVYEKIE